MVQRNGVFVSRRTVTVVGSALVFALFALTSPEVFADDTFTAACERVSGFFKNFETILKVASVSIVTIAVVFAGYQIAFAHKRLSDVAPLLIGGLLIGGASALASWFMSGWTTGDDSCGTTSTSSVQIELLPMDTLRV